MEKMKFNLRRVRLNAGGYEAGKFGSYWGTGAPLYRYADYDTGDIGDTIRAYSRDSAKREIVAEMFTRGITPVFFN